MTEINVLLVLFPGQGHINPSLTFSKRLIKFGANVTLSTSVSAISRFSNPTQIPGLDFAPFSDGYDQGVTPDVDLNRFCDSMKANGSHFLANLITERNNSGAPFTRIIYTTIMSWVGSVARNFRIPFTLLWIQPATVFDIYYHYFKGYKDLFRSCARDDKLVEIPGVPRLSSRDFPSFLIPTESDANDWAIRGLGEQFEVIDQEESPKILVNTFDDLEFDALRAIEKVRLIGIGPLIPSAYLDGRDPSDKDFGGDMRAKSNDYVEWLDSKTTGSVVYIAFGSYSELPIAMMEEIAQGVVRSGVPFLWVVREEKNSEKPEEKLSCKAELEKHGKIVRWCTQVEVLQHPSVGCFLTHCGWNSTSESLASGVPLVACPLWNDQLSNAKLIHDVWKCGVRVSVDEQGVVKAHEIKRCIECVMGGGEKGEEVRKNALKWKDLAKGAMKENGSSYLNLKAYVYDELLSSV